jgi:hypothetical protein
VYLVEHGLADAQVTLLPNLQTITKTSLMCRSKKSSKSSGKILIKNAKNKKKS